MTKLFLLSFLTMIIASCKFKDNINSTGNQDSITYIKKSIAFIKQVKQKELSDTDFLLNDKPFSFDELSSFCIDELSMDTIFFTKGELEMIKDKKYPHLFKWTKESFKYTKLVNSDTINAIFKDHSKGWNYFYKKIGRSFNTMSVPIFLKNDNYCLFYSDNHCGGLCGEGILTLYKKEKGNWIKIKSYCNWVS